MKFYYFAGKIVKIKDYGHGTELIVVPTGDVLADFHKTAASHFLELMQPVKICCYCNSPPEIFPEEADDVRRCEAILYHKCIDKKEFEMFAETGIELIIEWNEIC